MPAPADVKSNDEDEFRRGTETRRLQRSRTNHLGLDDERTEGNVVEVRCTGQTYREVDVANRDGLVTLRLIRDAASDCAHIAPGDYLEGDGQKETEQLYWIDNLTIRKR